MAVKQEQRRVGSGFWMVWKLILFFALFCGFLQSSSSQSASQSDSQNAAFCDGIKKVLTPEKLAESITSDGAAGPFNDGERCLTGGKPKVLTKEEIANKEAEYTKALQANTQASKLTDQCDLVTHMKKVLPEAYKLAGTKLGKNCKSKICTYDASTGGVCGGGSTLKSVSFLVILLILLGIWVN